jgi:predicted Zn-dependent protease
MGSRRGGWRIAGLTVRGITWALLAVLAAGGAAVAVFAAEPPAPARAAEAVLGPSPTDARVQEAIALWRAGDTEGGMAMLRAAVAANPNLSRPQVILAEFLGTSNQSQLARAALEQAVVEDPADPEVYVLLADIAQRERRSTEACLLYAKALELAGAAKGASPRFASMRVRAATGAAQVAESRRDWKFAQVCWDALLAAEPKNSAALFSLARTLFHQGKPEAAWQKVQETAAGESGPGGQRAAIPEAFMAQLYHERAKASPRPDKRAPGLTQEQQEDERQAGQWMVKALNKAPRDFRTRLAAAQWALDIAPWYGAKKLDEAGKQAQLAATLNPASPAPMLILAQIALLSRDYPAAEKLLREFHAVAPSNASAVGLLAIALVEQPEEAKKRVAVEYAQLAYRAMSDYPEASAPLAWVLYRLGRVEEAERAIAQAVGGGSRPGPDTVYFLARILAQRGHKAEAYRLLDKGTRDIAMGTLFLLREPTAALLKELAPAPGLK